MTKHHYAIQCDRLQNLPQGPEIWASLLNHASPISWDEMSEACDFTALFDEGETLADFISDDDQARAYRIDLEGQKVYVLSKCGFEYFLTQDGRAPTFIDPHDPDGHEVRSSALARLLLRCGHPLVQGNYGNEHDCGVNEQGLQVIGSEQGGTRYQLFANDRPIAGARIEDGVITDIYTLREFRRKGIATQLLNAIKQTEGPIRFSSSLTDDGKAFKARYQGQTRRPRDDQSSLDW